MCRGNFRNDSHLVSLLPSPFHCFTWCSVSANPLGYTICNVVSINSGIDQPDVAFSQLLDKLVNISELLNAVENWPTPKWWLCLYVVENIVLETQSYISPHHVHTRAQGFYRVTDFQGKSYVVRVVATTYRVQLVKQLVVILNQCNGGISWLIIYLMMIILYKGKLYAVEYIYVTLVMWYLAPDVGSCKSWHWQISDFVKL